MRPSRADIAAPELPPRLRWIGDGPASMATATAAGPVLVHFIDFAQLNSVRTLPYVRAWHKRYADGGLTVLGVQTPRLPFGADADALARALERLGVRHPVALDAERELWLDYGCEGWPSLFLWARGGALAWYHFGEGEYLATEEAIQDELREADALQPFPSPVQPLRATDAPGAEVIAPSPELFPAGERAWRSEEDGDGFVVEYEAGSAHATAEGTGEIQVRIDGGTARTVEISGAGLYDLAEHEGHEAHRLELDLSPGVGLWSVSFAPGVPPARDEAGGPG